MIDIQGIAFVMADEFFLKHRWTFCAQKWIPKSILSTYFKYDIIAIASIDDLHVELSNADHAYSNVWNNFMSSKKYAWLCEFSKYE